MAQPSSTSEPEKITPEEYLRREALAEHKSDFLGGVMLPLFGWDADDPTMMAGASRGHHLVTSRITRQLGAALPASCDVLGSDVKIERFGGGEFVYADLVVACGPVWRNEAQGVLENPQLIVEVLSPSTELRDRTQKFALYESLPSVQAILLLSPSPPRAELFTRRGERLWLREAAEGGTLWLPSFEIGLDLDATFAELTPEP